MYQGIWYTSEEAQQQIAYAGNHASCVRPALRLYTSMIVENHAPFPSRGRGGMRITLHG